MPINAPVSPLLDKSPGNTAVEANRIQSANTIEDVTRASSDSVRSLQRQIDTVVAAMKDSPAIQEFEVMDSSGGLIGWIGSKIVGAASYMGAWFKQLRIGGTSAADAKIVADAAGNVTINGATIVINSGGVTTDINNVSTPPFGVLSLKSTDNSLLYWTGIHPFGVDLVDDLGNSLAYVRSGGGSGHIRLANVAATKVIQAVTGGAGSPKVEVISGATTVALSTGTTSLVDLSIAGSFSGTHAQNVGTGDSPTFADASGGGSSLSALLALTSSLQAQINSLSASKADHGGGLTGTADLVTGAVTGTIA